MEAYIGWVFDLAKQRSVFDKVRSPFLVERDPADIRYDGWHFTDMAAEEWLEREYAKRPDAVDDFYVIVKRIGQVPNEGFV